MHQGRVKLYPVELSEYVLTICRYVERNPVRADLVERAEPWRWSSAGTCESVPLQEWPMVHLAEWLGGLNEGDRRKNW